MYGLIYYQKKIFIIYTDKGKLKEMSNKLHLPFKS